MYEENNEYEHDFECNCSDCKDLGWENDEDDLEYENHCQDEIDYLYERYGQYSEY